MHYWCCSWALSTKHHIHLTEVRVCVRSRPRHQSAYCLVGDVHKPLQELSFWWRFGKQGYDSTLHIEAIYVIVLVAQPIYIIDMALHKDLMLLIAHLFGGDWSCSTWACYLKEVAIVVIRVWKDFCDLVSHLNWSFRNNWVNGAVITPKSLNKSTAVSSET